MWNIIESIKEFTLVKRNVTLHCNVREIKFDMICGQWQSLGAAVCQFNQLKPPFPFCPFTFYTALHRGVQEEQFGGYRGRVGANIDVRNLLQ